MPSDEATYVPEDEQKAPLLGPPKLPEFDSFMESSVLNNSANGDDNEAQSPVKPGKGAPHTAYQIPEAFRAAPRFMNIPELSSASAEWNSPNMKTVFILTMVLSIFEIILSVPLAMILVGVLPIVAAILGIIAASNHLCESCQGPVMDSNISVIKTLTIVSVVLDCLFLSLFWCWIMPAVLLEDRSNGGAVVLVWFAFTSPSMIHAVLSLVVLRKANAVQRVLHPVQPGTVLVT